jgi:hypothetical protein
MTERSAVGLRRDTRGAQLVEYLVLVGMVALVTLAATRRYGQSLQDKALGQAACVTSLDCAATGSPVPLELRGARGEQPPGWWERFTDAIADLAAWAGIGGGESGAASTGPERAALIEALLDAQYLDGTPRDEAAAAAIADALMAGDDGDDVRDAIHDYFEPLALDGSTAAMDAIRDAGLLDSFLAATLRDRWGNDVDPRVLDATRTLMATGRLDVYAETLASKPISLYDPDSLFFRDRGGNHHYWPQDSFLSPAGIYLNADVLADQFGTLAPGTADYDAEVTELAKTLAHEVYHAFNADHGGPQGAVNEGLGIAAIPYAFGDDDYDMAEMIYGTKNFYRDNWDQPDYPLEAVGSADAELTELIEAFAVRDASQVAWDDQEQLEREYAEYWEPIDRDRPWAEWEADADQATEDMLDGRTHH